MPGMLVGAAVVEMGLIVFEGSRVNRAQRAEVGAPLLVERVA